MFTVCNLTQASSGTSLPNQTQDQTTLQLPESKGLKRDLEADEPDMDVDHISWDTSWEQVQINLVSWIQEIEEDIEEQAQIDQDCWDMVWDDVKGFLGSH